MNEMRKLMESIEKITEGFSDNHPTEQRTDEEFYKNIIDLTNEADELLDSDKPIDQKFRVLDQIMQDIHNMTSLRSIGKDFTTVEEANQGGKTEHSGAKKGKGAYYGRKKEAKRDSNKNRRNADKAATKAVDEGKDSAALHTVNANYAQLKKELVDLVAHHKNERDPDVWYLLQDLESIIERYTK